MNQETVEIKKEQFGGERMVEKGTAEGLMWEMTFTMVFEGTDIEV